MLEAGKWSAARDFYASALREEVSADALYGLAESLWWTSEFEESIACYQRAFTAYEESGDWISAGWTAIALSVTYKCSFGNESAANGWLARAESAASRLGTSPITGWIWSLRGFLALSHDLEAASDLMRRGLDFAVSTGDRDLELVTRADLGEAMVMSGRVAEGLQLVDESMAGVSAGEHKRHQTVVFVSCIMFAVCDWTSDLERANRWSQVVEQFIDRLGCVFLYSECRALYSRILVANGRWAEAERELAATIKLTRGVVPFVYALATASLADLRLRQGYVEEAERLLDGVEPKFLAALPLASAKLAQGHASVSLALLERVLRNVDAKSIIAVRALELMVEAHLRNGDVEAAEDSVDRLNSIVCDKTWSEGRARASMAAGRVAAANGDISSALGFFEKAADGFSRLELPLEAARARLSIAETSIASNDFAVLEAQGALHTFEDLGARLDADVARALLRRLGKPTRGLPRPTLLTKREEEVLRLIGSGLSNPEIAERLVITRKTAAHHVSSLLTKLALRNRAEAAAYAAGLREAV
jgi:DNA-binding CsgD family transcriptional regulator